MQSTVGINQGIEIVFHKVKNEMGLAYTKQRDLLVGSEKVNEGYLFDDPSFSIPRLPDNNHKFFLSLRQIISREVEGTITVVSTADIETLATQNFDNNAICSRDPLLAHAPGSGFGFVYPNENCLQKHFPNGLWAIVDGAYEIPNYVSGMVAFISVVSLQQSLLHPNKSWEPVQFVAPSVVKVACGPSEADTQALVQSHSKVSFRSASAPVASGFVPPAVAPQRTPAPAALLAGGKGRSRGDKSASSDSTGHTTVGDADSSYLSRGASSARSTASALTMSALSAPGTAHSDASPASSPRRSSRNASSSSFTASPASSQAMQAVVSPKTGAQARSTGSNFGHAAGAAAAKPKSVESGTHYRLPGPSDVQKEYKGLVGRHRSSRGDGAAQTEAERDAVRRFASTIWPQMRTIGWSCIWLRNPITHENMETFTIPGIKQYNESRVENMQYFHSKESLSSYVDSNPCLSDSWPQLWERLQAAGWRKVEQRTVHKDGTSSTHTACMVLGFAAKLVKAAHTAAGCVASAAGSISDDVEESCGEGESSAESGSECSSSRKPASSHNGKRAHGTSSSSSSTTSTHFSYTRDFSSLEGERDKGLVPGIHLFVSKAALMHYIAGFPYLLKSPEQLCEWLASLGWEVDTQNLRVKWASTKQDKALTARWKFRRVDAAAQADWMPIKDATRRLWLCPERMFMHAKPPAGSNRIPLDHMIECIRLTEEAALAADVLPPSPSVPGMSVERRDRYLRKLRAGLDAYLAMFEKQNGNNAKAATEVRAKELNKLEHNMGSLLLALRWTNEPPHWAEEEWWKGEIAWVAPWTAELVQRGKRPLLGRDFFWTMERIAQYAALNCDSDKLFSPFLEMPDYKPSAQAVLDEERKRTDHQLKFIARNCTNPFAEWPVADMLASTGWITFEEAANKPAAAGRPAEVVFIPFWKTKQVSEENYQCGALGVDYHNVRTLLDHLEEFGNVPPKKPKSPKPAAVEEEKAPAPKQQKVAAPKQLKASAAAAVVVSSPPPSEAVEPSSGSSDGSSCSSADSTIVFHGQRYAANSTEALVREMLDQNRFFGPIFTHLKTIGWGSVWCRKLDFKLILPPWAYEVKEAFSQGNSKVVIDHTRLVRWVDYFEDDSDGKAAMLEYLDRRGFVRRLHAYDPFEGLVTAAAGKQASSSSSAANASSKTSTNSSRVSQGGKAARATHDVLSRSPESAPIVLDEQLLVSRAPGVVVEPEFSPKGVVHHGVAYHIHTPEYRLLYLLFKELPANFGRVYTVLKEHFLWGNHYVSQVGTLICASWALDVEGAFEVENSARYRMVNHSLLTEGVHYWQDTDEGKAQMLHFLRCNGIEPPGEPVVLSAANVAAASSAAASKVGGQPSRKRKADTSAAPDEEVQEVQCRAVTVTTLPALSSELNENAAAARRSRRGAPINPALEQDMLFVEDWQFVKRAINSERLVLTAEGCAEQVWMALNAHNKSWRCLDDLQQNPLFVRSEGCNAYYLGNFTEGVDYFRSLEDAFTFIQQQVALLGESELLLESKGKKEGKKEEKKGKEKKESPGLDTGLQGLTLHKRSPVKAVYQAEDQAYQFDRLAVPPAYHSPPAYSSRGSGSMSDGGEEGEEDEDNNYFTASAYHSHSKAAYDVDLQEAFNALASPVKPPAFNSQCTEGGDAGEGYDDDNEMHMHLESDTGFLPLTQQCTKLGDEGPSLVELLSATVPNFERIFQCLPQGWTFAYVAHGAQMPEGDLAFGGKVYLRPGCSLQDPSLVKNEDYFTSEESLIDYLRVMSGLQNMPQELSNSKKPRVTRRGTVIDTSYAPGSTIGSSSSGLSTVGSPLITVSSAPSGSPADNTHQSRTRSNRQQSSSPSTSADTSSAAVGEKRGRVGAGSKQNSDAVQMKRQRSSSIQSTASTTSHQQHHQELLQQWASTPPLPAMTLRERIQTVRRALVQANMQSAYSGHWDAATRIPLAEVSRAEEFRALKTTVVRALTQVRGAALYLCGSPGMGKTLTVVDCLDGVAQDRLELLSCSKKGSGAVRGASRGSPARKGTAADSAAELGYQVVWLNGASLNTKNDAYTFIAETLGLNTSSSTYSSVAQMLTDRFTSPGQPVELSQSSLLSDIEDSCGSDEDDVDGPPSSQDTQTTSKSVLSRARKSALYAAGSSSSKRGRRSVPMTVLVVDELDMASREVMGHLVQLSTAPTSSLLLIGMGNNVTLDLHALARGYSGSSSSSGALSSAAVGALVKKVVFRPYGDTQLVQIVKRLTGDLFHIMARSMLAKKVVAHNKGDVRALLQLAEISLDRAASELQGDTDGPSREIVEARHVNAACTSSADLSVVVGIIETLPIKARLLLFAMVKHAPHYAQNGGYSEQNIVSAYSDYLEQKHLQVESYRDTMQHLAILTNYNLVRPHESKKKIYEVQVPFALLLKAQYGDACTTEAVHKELKQIKTHISRSETEATLTQY